MFAYRALAVLSFAAVAFSGPLMGRNPVGDCDVGKMQCCQSVSTPNSPDVMNMATNPSLLALLASLPVNTPINLSCSPAGAGSGVGCDSNPVCCDKAVYQDGLVNVGCTPFNFGDL